MVAVEPFRMDDSEQVIEASSTGSKRCIGGECTTTITDKIVGHGVSAQLVTALTNAGNLSVVDMAAVKKQKGGIFSFCQGLGIGNLGHVAALNKGPEGRELLFKLGK